MRKRTISTILLTPVIIVVFVYGLLISPLGGPTIRVIANNLVNGLSIKSIEGGLADNITISHVKWENAQWRVHADYVYLDVTWRCIFEPRVCVNEMNANDIIVEQLSTSPKAESTEETGSFTLPLPIEVSLAKVERFTLKMPGETVELGKLSLDDFLGNDTLAISSLSLENLAVTLHQDEVSSQATASSSNANNSDAASETYASNSNNAPESRTDNSATNKSLPKSYSLSYTAPELPTVSSPIPIKIGEFSLTNGTLNQGDSAQTLSVFAFEDFEFANASVSLANLNVEHPQGTLSGDIAITLDGAYPLSVSLNGSGLISDNQQQVDFQASGSLAALEADLKTEGAMNAKVNLSADVLSDNLPISFSATWKKQPLPTMKSGTLHDGALTLNGTMGDYLLDGGAAATLPDIGKVPVALNVVLKEHNIFVNEAKIEALEGSISNTGTLYLDEAISWEGNTTFTNVSGVQFSKYAPAQLEGGFTSVMQYTEKGPHVSIRELDLKGILQNKPFSVAGAFVYSGPSDLLVASLTVEQADNKIDVIGQLLNKRYINADIGLNVAAIADLYPEIAGAISGNIKATGPWTNPIAIGALNFSNITVSPALSNAVAQQGEINGKLVIDGSYTDHKADLDVTIPEHSVALSVAGKWQDNTWAGQVEQSKLKLANMQWALSSPFALNIGSAPFSASVGEHCWHSREDGELCITSLNYQENKAKWNVWAKALPVGLWAYELAPDMIAAAAPATLSMKTQGQYSQADPIDATFTASLSPATWQLGKERPLAITVNSVETTGTFRQGELKSQSLINSEDLGNATLNVNTSPFETRKPISGNLELVNIDVAPLKPLSPAIRTLTGVMNGTITLAGFIDSPDLTGELQIENGAIDIQDTPVSLENWTQSITLNGQQANFDGTFLLGGGKGALNGDLNWSDVPSANINLKGDKFEVRQPNMRLRVSPDLKVAATADKVDVTGSVNIPWARIEVESLPESAVSPSKDVHLRGEPPKEEPLDIVHASVMVNIDKAKTGEVKLEAFGLTASLHGGVKVNNQPALVGFGDLQILNGRYNAYGQQLVIQTGEVQFNGPIDQPMLLIEAIRDPDKTDDDVIAGIRIDGAADSPSINLFSEPAMDQQNVLSYLLTGSGPDAESEDPNYAALLVGFGLSNTKTLTGQVGKALGIDDFSLSTNENKLSVTGQINDRLTAEYNVDVGLSNNDSSSTLRRRQEPPDLALRYRLLPRLFLEAVQTTIEDQSEFALDLYYEFFLGEEKDDDDDVVSKDESSDTSNGEAATPKAANSKN
ncbi:translocation/assembly module TamB domain-containing protein [Alteromonas lipotrueae]|uniref:translocation/assembly module TamB domain-containing protein n=1 Tax=Alteromonas lipotrueae TaxID=2803814 RepID=UPI001C44FBBC|nr:translocation/assembly module TamB domain-containing protein [Alteromonas lipotrueae]